MKHSVHALWAAALACVCAGVAAHPGDDWHEIRRVVYTFASGMTNDDLEAITGALSADGRFMGLTREAYLDRLASGVDVSNVVIEHATYEPVDGGVRISPIVAEVDGGTFQLAWAAKAAQVDGAWRLVSIEPTNEFPDALVPTDLPELVPTIPVAFTIVDAKTGVPASARVSITDARADYWPPRGHQKHIRVGWREDVGRDVRVADKTWAYVPSQFVADLPEGDFTIAVAKGVEYEPATMAFAVSAQTGAQKVALTRWADMNSKGWYSGDTHVHFLDDRTALLELEAEDLNVMNVLATKWGELITNVEHVTGAPSPLSTPDRIVYFNEETRHAWLGHTILHGLKSLVYPLTWGGPSEGVRGGFDYPPMAHQADQAHAQGGMVTWAHFPFPGGELAVDIALGKIDSVDLFTWGDAFADPAASVPGAVSLWYKFLNTGFRLPATAGTDKMLNVQVVGSVRTYAQVDGKFDYDAWLDAVRTGRTFVTTGPLLSLSANGARMGDTLALANGQSFEVEAEVHAPFDRYPVDTLEIVVGGEVVAVARNTSGGSKLRATASLVPRHSSWVAARAYGSTMLPYQIWPLLGQNGRGVPVMAHTSPIYLEVDGEPARSPDDAQVLEAAVDRAIDWVKREARFQREEERAEMVALFEKAKAVYVRAR